MRSIYGVGQVNYYIKNMFAQDFLLNQISVKGEVSNCKYHTSRHIYFSLKDETGMLSCMMFAGKRKGLAFPMKNGDRVVVSGNIGVYERDGKYQLYAEKITLEGAGQLYERFLALKQELEDMGMFAEEYKQPIPAYAQKIGVVTAPTGAAIQDIRTIAARRNPYVQLILYPAVVQGDEAKESIIKGIQTLTAYGVDVLIVGRGGGSMEDLWVFNEEEVARAIFHCPIPVISAVGHETDVTIADYAADLRAPTPSAAAELAVSDIRVLYQSLQNSRRKLQQSLENRLRFLRQNLHYYQTKLTYISPSHQVQEKRAYLLHTEARLQKAMERQIYDAKQSLQVSIERMKGLSPLKKLQQGFSYVENEKRHAVTSVTQVQNGEMLLIQVEDGTIVAQTVEKRQKERGVSQWEKWNAKNTSRN